MYFFPYLGCVLLGVDSLRGGLAAGNRFRATAIVRANKPKLRFFVRTPSKGTKIDGFNG